MVMVNKVDGPPELNMTFKLSCDVTGPVDSTYWMRNGTYLQSNDRTSFSNRNMTLTFSPVEHSDNGDYRCVAMNAVSERNSSEYMLMVYCKYTSIGLLCLCVPYLMIQAFCMLR